MDAVLYIHGKGGSADEAGHYKPLFPGRDVIGVDYKGSTPWEAGREIHKAITELKPGYGKIILIANSIGAYYAMNADIEAITDRACFISPVVDMEKLIADMMGWACVTEPELQKKRIIRTDVGDDLSWEYLCYARENPVRWNVPTDILYGSKDYLTSFDTIKTFADKHNADLTVMENGEHWFHTDEQMRFLDEWIEKCEAKRSGRTMLLTERMRIYPASLAQMEAMIASEQDAELKKAYTEMLEGCLRRPDQWDWYAAWMIEKTDGTHIGDLCFKGLREDGIAEIGYGILEAYQGQGYATEAVRAACRWAFDHAEVKSLEAETDVGNTASQRVLEKCGFCPDGTFGEEGPRFSLSRPIASDGKNKKGERK